jgi:putative tricarboxylic transport membrane protein
MAGKKEPKQAENPVASGILLAFGLAVALGSLKYGFGSFDSPGAGFLPFFAGAGMAVFSAAAFFQSLRGKWAPLGKLWSEVRWRRAAVATVCLLVYSFLLRDLGFLISTFILMTYLFRMLEPSGWKETLFAAFATTFGFYLVFQVWLEAQLPRGPLGF